MGKTFEEINQIKCKTEKKGQFNYVSWTDAWTEFKKIYPGAKYKIYENQEGFPCFFNETGGMVKVGVILDELEYVNWMPVLDYSNKSVAKEKIDTFQINKAIQRAFVKAIAMHGLGLYVYRGEDFPEETSEPKGEPKTETTTVRTTEELTCKGENCSKVVDEKVYDYSQKNYGKTLCYDCQKNTKAKNEKVA